MIITYAARGHSVTSLRLLLPLSVLVLTLACSVARGQTSNDIPAVGFLATAPMSRTDPLVEFFSTRLRELGYIDGQNVRIEFRSAQGQAGRLPFLAQELVQAKVNVIVVGTEPAVRAAKEATTVIPIVAISFDHDLVASGLVASYNRPDANVTGINTRQPELLGKRLELLKDMVPNLSRIAVLWDAFGKRHLDEVKRAARNLHIELEPIHIGPPYDFTAAFKTAKQRKAGAVLLVYSLAFYAERSKLAEQALAERMPIMSWMDLLTRAGGLVSYGPDAHDSYRHIADFAAQILKGVKVSDLPVEQSTHFRLVVNLKTAKALGLAIPESIMLRADEIIQ
jgi:putative tryptophan/tyrosine transport system substrate-binding protein